jgi:hypothetical protein
MFTWYSPTSVGVSPANCTSAATPPIVTVTGFTVVESGLEGAAFPVATGVDFSEAGAVDHQCVPDDGGMGRIDQRAVARRVHVDNDRLFAVLSEYRRRGCSDHKGLRN